VLIVSGDLRGVIVTGEIDIAATSLLDSAVTESGSADASTGLRVPTRLPAEPHRRDVPRRERPTWPSTQEHAEANGFQVRAALVSPGSAASAPGSRSTEDGSTRSAGPAPQAHVHSQQLEPADWALLYIDSVTDIRSAAGEFSAPRLAGRRLPTR
jgi:hypothetical protein